ILSHRDTPPFTLSFIFRFASFRSVFFIFVIPKYSYGPLIQLHYSCLFFYDTTSAIILRMILVTGATGFIGRALVRQLSETGQRVRVLLRPSPRSPRLPKGVPVEVAVVSLNDASGVRAALRGVDEIYHLASAGGQGQKGSLLKTDIEGTRTLAQVAASADIKHLVYLSQIGADRASAFPIHKSKGIAEEHI